MKSGGGWGNSLSRKTLVLVGWVSGFVLVAAVSVYISWFFQTTDYPCYYLAAKTIGSSGASLENVYGSHLVKEARTLPETLPNNFVFAYSIPVALLFLPLKYLPYHVGKALFAFISIVAYFCAIYFPLKTLNIKGKHFFYLLTLPLLWIPFLNNVRFVQTGSFLLFLVALGVFLCSRGRFLWGGVSLGAAALFKIYPLGMAFFLGLKNWRILVAGIVLFFGALFSFPGWHSWFRAILESNQAGTTPILASFGLPGYLLFVAVLSAVSAWIVVRSERRIELIAAFSIPTMLLLLPSMGTRHLTVFVYSLVVVGAAKEIPWKNKVPLIFIGVFIALDSGFSLGPPPESYGALFLFWLILGQSLWRIATKGPASQPRVENSLGDPNQVGG